MRIPARIIILGGLLLAMAAFAGVYLAGTSAHRSVAKSKEPALAWLQKEYQLSDTQFQRIIELHQAYAPKCQEMCRIIDAKNAEISALLAATDRISPAIRLKLAEAAQIRAECQAEMLEHFFQVAHTMPSEQSGRYLRWVRQEFFMPGQMEASHSLSSE